MVLILFMISIFAISTVSASEDVNSTLTTDDAVSGDVVSSFNEDLAVESENSTISSDVDEINVNDDDVKGQDVLASYEDDEVLCATPISYLNYKIDLNDKGYDFSAASANTITYYLSPCQTYAINAYNFVFVIFQKDEAGNYTLVYKTNKIESASDRTIGNHKYTFPAKLLAPGLYTLAAFNDGLDNQIMDATDLRVKGNAVISASDYNSYYNSGVPMTVKVTDKSTQKPLKYVAIKGVFSDGKDSATVQFVTNAQGQFSVVPPFSVGTYTVTYSSNYAYISASPIKKTIVVTKAPVTVTAKKVSAYQGYKVTLKAIVKSQGKNVNEGTVTFKINGKTYKADVKNGVATKKVKLSKAKTYKYTAKFNGDNFQDSAAASSSAVIKKVYATKLTVKNQVVYRDAPKKFYVTVKTSAGKLVKSGKVKIIDTVKVNKKGKATFYTAMDMNYIKQIGNTVYFKKTAKKTYKVKYIPSSKAYKSSTTKVKITMKYRCSACGATTSHSHPSMNMRFIVS